MAELAAVASIIQIADVGFRLSVRLYEFAETVANADKAIHFTSKDVALTSSVLKEVGEVLRNDQSFRTYSPEAIETATAIVTECSNVFQEMEKILADKVPSISSRGAHRGSKASMTLERFKWPYWQPKIQLLRSNLDRLRSTLSVMLNVIIYRRLSDKEPASVHASKMTLIRNLIKSEEKYKQKYKKLERSIMDAETINAEPLVDSDESPTLSISRIVGTLGEHSRHNRESQKRKVPATGFDHENETNVQYIRHLMSLFDRLIIEVNTPGYQIGQRSRERIRFHVYEARSGEVSQLYNLHGKFMIDQTLKINGFDPDNHTTPADFHEGQKQKQKRRREDRENSTESHKTRRRGDRRNQDLVSLRHHEESTHSRQSPHWQRQNDLNEFFILGEGIHREILEQEICAFLGPEAYYRPATYNGNSGYILTALRPFTPKMLEDLIELSTSYSSEMRELSRPYSSEIRRMQERPLFDLSVGSIPPFNEISEHRSSHRPNNTHSGSAYGNTRYQSGPAYPSTGEYADARAYERDPRATRSATYPSTGGYKNPRMDRGDLRMDPRDSRLDSRDMPSYPPSMSLVRDASIQRASDDPRHYDYVSSIPPLQSSREMPFQSDRLGSIRRAGNVPLGYYPQEPQKMRDNGKAPSLREEQRPPAALSPDLRDWSINDEELLGLTGSDDSEITESRPVHDTTKSKTLNDSRATLVPEPVGEGEDHSAVPTLHSKLDEPHPSMKNPSINNDRVTERLDLSEPSSKMSNLRFDRDRVALPVPSQRGYTPLQPHGAYDRTYGPAESDRPRSSKSASPSHSPSPKVQTSEEKMEVDAQRMLDEMLGLWKPVAQDQ